MEDPIAVRTFGKFSSGSLYATIDKEARDKLHLDTDTKFILKIVGPDSLLLEIVRVVKGPRFQMPPIVERE